MLAGGDRLAARVPRARAPAPRSRPRRFRVPASIVDREFQSDVGILFGRLLRARLQFASHTPRALPSSRADRGRGSRPSSPAPMTPMLVTASPRCRVRRAQSLVALRVSMTSLAVLDDTLGVVDGGVVGQDEHRVGAFERFLRERNRVPHVAVLVREASERADRGSRCARRPCRRSSITLSAGDSRQSSMSFLYATPRTRISDSLMRLALLVERAHDFLAHEVRHASS